MKYDIQMNPLNPVEYLACCGLFEILTRFDPTATSWWEIESQPRFWLESKIDEASLLICLTQTFSNWTQWQKGDQENQNDETLVFEDEQESGEESDNEGKEVNEGILLSLQFSMNDKTITLNLDWWYETLTSQKGIKEKSGWKMYAGNQTAEKTSRDMTTTLAKLIKQNPITNIAYLIKLCGGMTGRFGFDPRSSRNALDTGYSANDLKLPVATYPFVELLTMIGIQHFFPHRNRQSGGITSSRGWIDKYSFQYGLWITSLPIALARMAAIGVGINKDNVIPLLAKRANRDKYSNFRMATMTTWKKY